MFVKNVYTFRNLPVEEKERNWTDCLCTIIGALFALGLFITSCVAFNKNNFLQVNYPVESTGKLCYLDLSDAPFIYFALVNDFTQQRYCVSACPKGGQQIQCSANDTCTGITSTYDTVETIHKLGGYCAPVDPTLNAAFWNNPTFTNKMSGMHAYEIMLIALAIGACVGLIYMIIFVLLPKIMTYLAFVFCSLTLLAAGIVLIVQPIKLLAFSGNVWNIIIGVILIVLAICFMVFVFCQTREIELASIFLTYANVFLKQNFILFAYIPLFMVFSFGLVVLCVWQFIAYGSMNQPTFQSADVYKTIQQNYVLQVLNFIEFVWGIQFIRDSFNFIISGNAVEWYFTYNNAEATQCCRSFTRLLCKNFGSVVGGSFLNAFLNLFGIVFDIFRCDPHGSYGRTTKCCRDVVCFCCISLFDLVRSDAYAYINLSGIPYCNACRQCQAICEQTHLFNSNHSCIRLYRIAAQIFVVTLGVLLTYIIFQSRTNFISMFVLAVVICNVYLMATHFVDLHSNAAEGLVTCYLAESNCEANNMEACPANLRSDVYNYEEKYNLLPLE